MPKNCFHIGDFVHCRHGFGYIMGMQHIRTITGSHIAMKNHKRVEIDDTVHVPWYMIGIASHPSLTPATEITHVVYDINPTLFEANPKDGLNFVQAKALDFMQPNTNFSNKSYHRQFRPGDIVIHKSYSPGIILSGGYHRPERKSSDVYHHVYYFDTGIFDYDCAATTRDSINNMIFCKPSDNNSHRIANQIVRDCYLSPIFSAQKETPVSGFVSANHIDFAELRAKFDEK